MTALQRLDEDELYLLTLLTDQTGIDQAEMFWVDEENDDRCYRAWDFQWDWYHCDDTYQVDQCGRSLGKSKGIEMRAFAFPFCFPGAEMMLTAPELNHLRPITDKVENLFISLRIGREMLPRTKGHGINHQPQFQARFANGSRIISRLPNRDGRGVKGQHSVVIETDEIQDYPEPGLVEIIETMKSGSVGAQWRCHGVSRGARGMYWRFTTGENPEIPFKVHKYMAPHRPTWSDEERRAKIALYGGTEENVDYRRNIYGEHGDAHNPIFVLARLMGCVRINESAWATKYNDEVYTCIKINDELHRRSGVPIENFLQDIPRSHLGEEYSSYWAGMDVGFTVDPTEILIWGVIGQKGKPDIVRQLLRVQLQRIGAQHQVDVVKALFEFYGPRLKRMGMDKTGNGLPLFQLMRDNKGISSRIAGYGFSEKLPVEFDDREPVGKEKPEDVVIEKNIIDYATDELRKLVDTGQLELPYDIDQLQEFQGQSVILVKTSALTPATRRYYGGSCHTLDAARMLVAARSLEGIEAILNRPKRSGPILERFI